MLSYKTAGESHGKGIGALIDGFPAGVKIDNLFIDAELHRRQGGWGRGERQKIEADTAEILTGVWRGETIGAPILLWVKNRDYKIESMPELTRPRPGHGDLTGAIKYGRGIRPILERSSARETAGRVAAGALARLLLRELGIEAVGFVVGVGDVDLTPDDSLQSASAGELMARRDASDLYSLRPDADPAAKAAIESARADGDALGGVVEVRVFGAPFGLGTHAQWDAKLDGKLARAAAAVQAIKGVEIGLGFEASRRRGSRVQDEILYDASAETGRSLGFLRPSNNAGGLEGGMTNAAPIVVRAAMKPIPTMRHPLRSVDLATREPSDASYERSDVCAISATSVVVENVVDF
ncbi:MAG: chorismate synthase, partial [Thermoguttaceae bacterium]|nr:chorismate synthase [Thermoguttaceae bacterium]